MSRLKLTNKLAGVVRRYYEQVLSTITGFRVSFQQSAHSKVLEVIDASEAHNGESSNTLSAVRLQIII
ncbi:hypothetical protein M0804_003205 [Polistes exclamans]|nr:hypothetical protein M0804_003205 [Polistes exclamans]